MREDTVEELWNAIADGDGSEEEDAVGDLSVARHVFRAGVVCFSFDPRKRHGKTLSQVHRPVPGYERKMRDAVARVFTNLQGGEAAVARQLGVAKVARGDQHGSRVAPHECRHRGRREPRESRRGASLRTRARRGRGRGRRERSRRGPDVRRFETHGVHGSALDLPGRRRTPANACTFASSTRRCVAFRVPRAISHDGSCSPFGRTWIR